MGYMGSDYNMPKAIFYLLKGDYKGWRWRGYRLGFKVQGFRV